jgi:hypothetical protein
MVGFLMDKKDNQIMVRLDLAGSTNAGAFKAKYKEHLEDALKNKQKVRVLFDTRGACTLGVFLELTVKMVPFFSITIKKLSESVVEKCILVIPSEDVATKMQQEISRLGGSVPTLILSKMPGESSS